MKNKKTVIVIIVVLAFIGAILGIISIKKNAKSFHGENNAKKICNVETPYMERLKNDPKEFFEVWQQFSQALNTMQTEDYAYYVKDLNSGWEMCFNEDTEYYSASAIKGPYVISVLMNDPTALDRSESSIRAAITVSDNNAYKHLRKVYGHPVFDNWLASFGCESAQREYDYAYVTAREMGMMWEQIYHYFQSDDPTAAYCKDIFEGVFHSFLSENIGSKYTVYSKAGWITGPYYTSENDAGLVMQPDHPYVIAILSTSYCETDKLGELAGALDAIHELAVRD